LIHQPLDSRHLYVVYECMNGVEGV
jgi:hypothetical protein